MQFQAHGHEVKALPPDSAVLAASPACKVQAFRAGVRTYCFQYHFECDAATIKQYADASGDSLAKAGLSAGDLSAQTERHYEMFSRLADRLCVNLATYLFPLARKMSA